MNESSEKRLLASALSTAMKRFSKISLKMYMERQANLWIKEFYSKKKYPFSIAKTKKTIYRKVQSPSQVCKIETRCKSQVIVVPVTTQAAKFAPAKSTM